MIENRFRIVKKLNQGGFGKVYQATNILDGTNVVIKVNLRPDVNYREYRVMKDLDGIEGFPRVISAGIHNK